MSPTEFFGTVRQKFYDRKSWYSPPPLIHKLFVYRNVDETQHRKVPLWNSSALSDKKFWQKIVILPTCSHLLTSENFFDTRNWWNTRGFPSEIFRHCETKTFRGKILIPPLLSINFLATGKLMKHSTERFPYGILRHRQTKNFWQKIVILPPSSHILPPSRLQFFSIPEISETLWGSPTKFFGTVRQIFSTENHATPPTLIHKLFGYPGSLMKHSTEGFPYGSLRHCQTKYFWQSFVILPPSTHIVPPSRL